MNQNKRPPKLGEEEIQQALVQFPAWSLRDGKLHRVLTFESFQKAFGFMTAVAAVAEEMDHHPNWRNSYRTVEIELMTHDSGGVTGRDFELAREIDRIASEFGTG